MNNPRFQLFKSNVNQQYYFHLKGTNGEQILSSEGYITKQACIHGITAVKSNAPIDSLYDRRNNFLNYTFNLKSINGEIIGRSENYTSEMARETGIASVKRNAPSAQIEDLTLIGNPFK